MPRSPRISTALLMLVSGLVGAWLGHEDAPAPPAPGASTPALHDAPAPRPTKAPATIEIPRPLIAVAHDGSVTLRVEQQPLQWVLEQIEAQAGPIGGAACGTAPAARTAARTAARAPATAPPRGAAQLESSLQHTMTHGDPAARQAALQRAGELGLPVPDELLERQFEADVPERLGLLAFDTYLEPLQDSPDGLRAALEEALTVANTAIREEAARRLAALAAAPAPDDGGEAGR